MSSQMAVVPSNCNKNKNLVKNKMAPRSRWLTWVQIPHCKKTFFSNDHLKSQNETDPSKVCSEIKWLIQWSEKLARNLNGRIHALANKLKPRKKFAQTCKSMLVFNKFLARLTSKSVMEVQSRIHSWKKSQRFGSVQKYRPYSRLSGFHDSLV